MFHVSLHNRQFPWHAMRRIEKMIGGAVALAQVSLCLLSATTPRQSLMDTRQQRHRHRKRRLDDVYERLMPSLEPIYPVDPPESQLPEDEAVIESVGLGGLHSHQQPQSRTQYARQQSSEDLTEDLTESFGLPSHQHLNAPVFPQPGLLTSDPIEEHRRRARQRLLDSAELQTRMKQYKRQKSSEDLTETATKDPPKGGQHTDGQQRRTVHVVSDQAELSDTAECLPLFCKMHGIASW